RNHARICSMVVASRGKDAADRRRTEDLRDLPGRSETAVTSPQRAETTWADAASRVDFRCVLSARGAEGIGPYMKRSARRGPWRRRRLRSAASTREKRPRGGIRTGGLCSMLATALAAAVSTSARADTETPARKLTLTEAVAIAAKSSIPV